MSEGGRGDDSSAVIPGRTGVVWVSGADRVSFLDGLLSQNIATLAPGAGARSLLLAPNGKLRAILRVLNTGDRIGLLCDAPVAESVGADLSRFKIRVDVSIDAEPREVWDVWGATAGEIVGYTGIGVDQRAEGIVAHYPLLRSALPRFVAIGFEPAGANRIGRETFEAVRIAAGEPIAGLDLDEKVIPQEVLDVATAVDFEKGCYLGQELVARIDSRGHVNRRLAGFTFPDGTDPAAGAEILVGERIVGRMTSVTQSPTRRQIVGLGIIRAEVEDGAAITAQSVPGTVTALPMA